MPNSDFLTAYRNREAQMRAEPLQELQQVGVLQKILGQVQAQQEEQQLRGVLAQSGGDPAKAVQALLKAGSPKALELAAKLQGVFTKPQGQPIGSGGLLMPGGNVVPPAARPEASKATGLSRLIAERDALPANDPRRTIFDNAIRKESETAKQISPTVIMPSPTKTAIRLRITACDTAWGTSVIADFLRKPW